MSKKASILSAIELGRATARVDVNTDSQWVTLRAKAEPIIATLPRKDGELDRGSDAFKTFRDEFKEGACETYAGSGEYDLALHRAGENEYHLASEACAANFVLTGAMALMDRAAYAALPSAAEAPLGLKRFVTLQRERIKGRADTALSRLLAKPETVEDMLNDQDQPRAIKTLEDALLGLYKSLESKRAKANQTTVCTRDELKAAIDALVKVAIKK